MLATTKPGEIFNVHGHTLLWMIVVVVAVRPLTFMLDTLIRNHAIVPNLVNLVRWQSHWHVIRQSWTFFQNDFAGRIANKIMQAGDAIETGVNLAIDAAWYALIFVVVAVVVLAQLDLVLLVPIAVWLLLYAILFSITMPLIARYSEEMSDSKSVMTGRIVDSYTNIQTLKTFSTGEHEDLYVSDSISDHTVSFRKLMRVFTYMWSILFMLNAGLVVSITWLALAGWNNGVLTAAAVATAIPFALQIMNMSGWILEIGSNIFRQIGTIRDSMDTIAQPLTMLDIPEAKPMVVTKGELVYDNVSFNYWRGKQGSVIDAFNLTVAAGRKDRPCRPLRLRQVDAGQPGSAHVRRAGRRHPHRRAGRAQRHPGKRPRRHWPCQPGYLPAAPLGPRKPQIRPPVGDRRGDDPGRRAGQGA